MLWLKSFHIVMVVSWFAGLFYLPRIFVNLAMETNVAAYDRLLIMARKLYRFVSPIMWLTLITGFWLWFAYFPIDMNWMWAKLVLVVGLVGYHVCHASRRRKTFQTSCIHQNICPAGIFLIRNNRSSNPGKHPVFDQVRQETDQPEFQHNSDRSWIVIRYFMETDPGPGPCFYRNK